MGFFRPEPRDLPLCTAASADIRPGVRYMRGVPRRVQDGVYQGGVYQGVLAYQGIPQGVLASQVYHRVY